MEKWKLRFRVRRDTEIKLWRVCVSAYLVLFMCRFVGPVFFMIRLTILSHLCIHLTSIFDLLAICSYICVQHCVVLVAFSVQNDQNWASGERCWIGGGPTRRVFPCVKSIDRNMYIYLERDKHTRILRRLYEDA